MSYPKSEPLLGIEYNDPPTRLTNRRNIFLTFLKVALTSLVISVAIYEFAGHSGKHVAVLSPFASNLDYINSTLGFQKIFAVEMPARLDRENAIKLQAAIHGLDIEMQPAIDMKNYAGNNYKGLTPSSKKLLGDPGFLDGVYGCYQAHLQLLKKIVDENLSSALILEGDAVFDVNIKQILADTIDHIPDVVNKGPNNFIKTNKIDDPFMSPNWDMFFLATCYDHDRFPDEYVEYPDKMSQGGGSIPAPKYYRRLGRSGGPTCTAGYAVSREGALKLLMKLSVDVDDPIDVKYVRYAGDETILAYTINPPPIGAWKYKGDLGIGGLDSVIHGEGVTAIKDKKKIEQVKSHWDDARRADSPWEVLYPENMNDTLSNAWKMIAQRGGRPHKMT